MMAEVLEKKNVGGRPLKFQSLEEMQSKIDAYFDSCYEIDAETGKKVQIEPFTITGLALDLDTSRETLMEMETQRSGYDNRFVDAIKRAKLRCHNYAEKELYKAKSPTGAIFALKNYGWKDVQTVENLNPGVTVNIESLNTLQLDDLLKLEEIMSKALPEVVDIEPNED